MFSTSELLTINVALTDYRLSVKCKFDQSITDVVALKQYHNCLDHVDKVLLKINQLLGHSTT